MRARQLIRAAIAVLVVLAVCGGPLALAGYYGHGPLSALAIVETHHEPEVFRELGEGGNPLAIVVGFTWLEVGYCSGQFHVSVTESPTEVRVGTVISRISRGGTCADLGTFRNQAWVHIDLAAPLGNRRVIRASDGAQLPVDSRFP